MKSQFLKRYNSTICLKLSESTIHKQATSDSYGYDLPICPKINQIMTLQMPQWSFLAKPYHSFLLLEKVFPCMLFISQSLQYW